MITNPHMLPKVRSESLKRATALMPCTLRVASFAGCSCAPQNTVVPAHLPVFGKGVSTKVSDLFVVAACHTCHDLLDGRDPRGMQVKNMYPNAWAERLIMAQSETLARWVDMGLITGEDWELV